MQSTKEEYHLTRDPPYPEAYEVEKQEELQLLQQQKRLLEAGMPLRNVQQQSGMEKLLVVLLVASATVCLLTNLLVLIILASTSKTAAASQSRNRSNRKTYKLALRYQLMKNQSLVGILTVLSAVYPLKLISMSLSHQQTGLVGKSQLENSGAGLDFDLQNGGDSLGLWSSLLSSERGCLLIFTIPIVAGPLTSMAHTVAIYFDLILRSLSPRNHAVLAASPKCLQWSLRGLVAFPFALAVASIAPKMSNFNGFCHKPWSLPFWCFLVTAIALLLLVTLGIFTSNQVIQRRRRKYLWPASSNGNGNPNSDTSELIPTRKRKQQQSSGGRQSGQAAFHTSKSAGGGRQPGPAKSAAGDDNDKKDQPVVQHPVPAQMTTMLVQTVDPPPFLNLSLPSVALLNFCVNLVLFMPILIHLYPHHSHGVNDNNNVIGDPFVEARLDILLMWGHLLVLASAAFNPVMHLMSDEALSGLGLDLIRKTNFSFSIWPSRPLSTYQDEQMAFDNKGFDED